MTSGTDWLKMKAKPAPPSEEQAAFIVEFIDALAEAVSMAWLNEHAPPIGRGGYLPHRGEASFLYGEWSKRMDTRSDLFHQAVGEARQGRPTVQEYADRRGKVRLAYPHSGTIGTTAHGSIPWYVPEGAEWEMEAERSTKEWAWGSRVVDRTTDMFSRREFNELDEYHARADQLHWDECETDDWISPPRRACRYYEDEMPTYFTPTSESYLEDGLKNGTSVEQDRAANNYPEGNVGVTRFLVSLPSLEDVRRAAGLPAKPERVLVPAVSSDPLDQLLDWLEGGWAT